MRGFGHFHSTSTLKTVGHPGLGIHSSRDVLSWENLPAAVGQLCQLYTSIYQYLFFMATCSYPNSLSGPTATSSHIFSFWISARACKSLSLWSTGNFHCIPPSQPLVQVKNSFCSKDGAQGGTTAWKEGGCSGTWKRRLVLNPTTAHHGARRVWRPPCPSASDGSSHTIPHRVKSPGFVWVVHHRVPGTGRLKVIWKGNSNSVWKKQTTGWFTDDPVPCKAQWERLYLMLSKTQLVSNNSCSSVVKLLVILLKAILVVASGCGLTIISFCSWKE